MYKLYVSLWDEHEGTPGIALYNVDTEKGSVEFVEKLNDKVSFGHSIVDNEKKLLYLCNETEKVWGCPCESGRIYVYGINEDGSINELQNINTFCGNPSYLTLTADKKYMVVANYGVSGAICEFVRSQNGKLTQNMIMHKSYMQLYRMNEDGTIGELLDAVENERSPERPDGESHAHTAELSPDGKFIATADKGTGMIYLYRVNEDTERIELCDSIVSEAGKSSPRHCVFHPTKPILIVNQEKEARGRMNLDSFTYDDNGKLTKICELNLVTEGIVIPERAHYELQGLCISKDGGMVYTAMKGPNLVACAKVGDDGMLSVAGYCEIQGEWPRGLAITPDGACIAATAHCSTEVNLYKLRTDGLLERTAVVDGPVGGADMSFA